MLAGHLAVGFAAKRITPRISLGTLVLASLVPDLVWCVFLIAGIEHVRFIERGATLMKSRVAFDIVYSHSLLANVIWAALFAGAYAMRRRYPRGAVVLFAAVLSHWLLDFVSHNPDMPLAPGVQRYFGLGLWNSIPATLLVEGLFWLVAVILYARATRPRNRAGVYAFWSVIVLLTAAWFNNIAGPPPPNPSTMGISSLIFFSLVSAWAYWMNRLREAPFHGENALRPVD